MRREIFRHMLRLPVGYFDRTPVGRLVTRVANDVEAINEMYTSMLVNLFRDAFLIVGVLLVMFRLEWRLALAILVLFPLIVIAAVQFRNRVRVGLPRGAAADRPHERVPAGIVLGDEDHSGLRPGARGERALRPDQPEQVLRGHEAAANLRGLPAADGLPELLRRRFGRLVRGPERAAREPLPRGAHCVHPVREDALRADPGALRRLQHPSGGHGLFRADLPRPGREGGGSGPGKGPRAVPGRDRVQGRLVRLQRGGVDPEGRLAQGRAGGTRGDRRADRLGEDDDHPASPAHVPDPEGPDPSRRRPHRGA